jgi:outer membrane receptor for ferrienterochelin and colicins
MNPGTTIIHLIALLALVASSCVMAQDVAEEDELNQFLDLLNQQTSLATNTRLNADFVPGMLSVLDAEQMQRRGFRTLWDALESLPGVQASRAATGERSISVRGIGQLFEPSKVKLLLNGVAVNASASATTGTLYDTPIEQIERVELIRGPGSATHGEFAYAGVLNVITKKQGAQYSVGIESYEGVNVAALYSYAKPDGDFKASINFAANQSDGEDIDSGLDRSSAGIPSYASGPINNKRDFVSAIASFDFGELNALIQFQEANRGDHFGANNLLPPDDKQTVISDRLISASLSQPFTLAEKLGGKWFLSAVENKTEKNQLFLGTAENFGGFGNEDDINADSNLEEQRFEAKVNLQYDGDAHTLFAEVSAADIDITESDQSINLDPVTGTPTANMNDFPGPVDDSQDRSSISLVLQDEYQIDPSLTLTTGLRYDDYEDIGSELSPRIALVWRQSNQHIFKAQLAHAFTPPTLLETGGSLESSIDPETNDTLEFGHIFHGSDLVVRNTVYFSRLDDLIVFQDSAPTGYKNTGSTDLRGYELEAEKSIGTEWKFIGSLSLQDYADDELPAAVPWMFKLGTEYRIMPMTLVHLQINSFGKRDRQEIDSRSDFGQTTQVDVSLRSRNFLDVDGLDFRCGIRNLLDETLKYPAPVDTYANDYPYSDGAMLWAQFSYRP